LTLMKKDNIIQKNEVNGEKNVKICTLTYTQ
jgi:hypothetical protein